MARDEDLRPFELSMKGKLVTADDPLEIGENFQTLTNLRYYGNRKRAVGGMTKINTTVPTTFTRFRGGFHYRKNQPAESHVMVQAFNSGLTSSAILDNTTDIPNQGDFSATNLFQESVGAGQGRFSKAPNGDVAYCNGLDALIWGGDEKKVARFISYDPAGNFSYDYTKEVQNTTTVAAELATVHDAADTKGYLYVGSTRPLKGIKFYVETANDAAGTTSVDNWTSSGWAAVTNLIDGTLDDATSMIPLGTKTTAGSLTFDSTILTCVASAINQIVLFWYRVTITNINGATTVSHVTVDAPMQKTVNIWDGIDRACLSFRVKKTYVEEMTINVSEEDYNTANDTTFADLSAMTAGTHYIIAGFAERIMGISIVMVAGAGNTTASTAMTVQYWNGAAWASVAGLNDGTSSGSISLNQSGVVTWTSPAKTAEFIKDNETEETAPLYYYKIYFSQNTSATVRVDYIGGITAPETMRAYKFPLFAKNSLWLCGNMDGDKNTAIKSMSNAPDVFNGDDSEIFYFGDETELMGGLALYSQKGSNIYDIVVIWKRNEMHGITGNSPSDFVQYPISETIGLIAPETLKEVVINISGVYVTVAIWQASDGIYIFDNTVPRNISGDIRNFFDENETSTRRLHPDYIHLSEGCVDEKRREYIWKFADGDSTGTLNRELHLNLDRIEWFEVDRGTYLQHGIEVMDTVGNKYVYGGLDTGYLERLEFGTDFDGTAITGTFQTGDIPLHKGSLSYETTVRHLKLINKAKTTTSNDITITHYGDSSTTGTAHTTSPQNSGKRLAYEVKNTNLGKHVWHSFKGELTTDDETYGFEPMFLTGFYKLDREDRR